MPDKGYTVMAKNSHGLSLDQQFKSKKVGW
jgi:hypothetical protein